MKAGKIFLSAVFLILLCCVLFAQNLVQAEATVDKTNVKLGDVIRYSLVIKRQGNNQQSPALQPPDFAGFRVMGTSSQSGINIINSSVNITYRQDFELMAIKQGDIVIKSAKVQVLNPTTKQYDVIQTKPIIIHVTSGKKVYAGQQETPTSIVPQQAYSDIKEIKMNLEFRLGDYLPYIILIVIFIAAVIIAYRYIFKKPEEKPTVVEDTDFRGNALKRLKKARNLIKEGDSKAFHYEIYETVREFLSKNFKESFAELTSLEIITRLDTKKITEAKLRELTDFLKGCDIVKFADYKPGDKEIENNYATAEKIIKEL